MNEVRKVHETVYHSSEDEMGVREVGKETNAGSTNR